MEHEMRKLQLKAKAELPKRLLSEPTSYLCSAYISLTPSTVFIVQNSMTSSDPARNDFSPSPGPTGFTTPLSSGWLGQPKTVKIKLGQSVDSEKTRSSSDNTKLRTHFREQR